MNGIIVIDKPPRFTSFDVVAVMRGLFGTKKVGHTGTLDPMATGVLPILIGSATKAQDLTPDSGKEYVAGFRLGVVTDTEDSTGTVKETFPVTADEKALESALSHFRGEFLMNGIIVIDKPPRFTSFDVVAVMRGLFGTKKVGHTGTLDPMATGVLPILIGSATKAQDLTPDSGKEYVAGFRLGVVTDTEDSTGTVKETFPVTADEKALESALSHFRGEILQVPPMYSAIQKNGVRLYDLARKGIEVEREARPVTIHELELLEYRQETGEGSIRVRCSKGTYVRTLCADLGKRLGCGGIMTSLRRTAACGYTIKDSIPLDEAKSLKAEGVLEQRLRPVDSLFLEYRPLKVTGPQAKRFQNGGALALERTGVKKEADGANIRVYGPDGIFLGLGRVRRGKNELSILKLF